MSLFSISVMNSYLMQYNIYINPIYPFFLESIDEIKHILENYASQANTIGFIGELRYLYNYLTWIINKELSLKEIIFLIYAQSTTNCT